MGPTRTGTGPRIIRRHPRILHRKECCSHRHRRGTHHRHYSHHPSQCRNVLGRPQPPPPSGEQQGRPEMGPETGPPHTEGAQVRVAH